MLGWLRQSLVSASRKSVWNGRIHIHMGRCRGEEAEGFYRRPIGQRKQQNPARYSLPQYSHTFSCSCSFGFHYGPQQALRLQHNFFRPDITTWSRKQLMQALLRWTACDRLWHDLRHQTATARSEEQEQRKIFIDITRTYAFSHTRCQPVARASNDTLTIPMQERVPKPISNS